MSREICLPPSAAALSASLRDIGYSLETAIADLIDNSISAEATSVDIVCLPSGEEPVLAISDNGHGMEPEELIAAMRHGSSGPRAIRSKGDLGRFGLGLKTASFSQCRKLTVLTSKNGQTSAAEWDLDKVDERDAWILSVLDEQEIESLPFQLSGDTGTVIIWRNLDRLFEEADGARRDEIVADKLDVVDRHISLVFHRFLSGEVGLQRSLSISVNGHPVAPFDPFCKANKATQALPREVVHIGPHIVGIQPYVLPHHSRLTRDQYDFYQNRSDFISNQGAYIYRNSRLMAWGDWFRLIPKGEATKLARVQIDFPAELDEAWTIDIKKSRARPPPQVRERMRQVISKISERSTHVHRGRGERLFQETNAPVWERYAARGAIRYALNRSHPLIAVLSDSLSPADHARLRSVLDVIESAIPLEMIYTDYSVHPRDITRGELKRNDLVEMLRRLASHLFGDGQSDAQAFLDVVRSTRLFDSHMEVVDQFIQEEL